MTDSELLERYVRTGSNDVLTAIVRRHVAAVYAAARRQVPTDELAEDVTQATFILLAQRAHRIRHPHLLAGWLMKVTRYCAADARKMAARRAFHEAKAARMNTATTSHDPAAAVDIADQLDVHLASLGDLDRTVIVLRCLEERPLSEVAQTLHLSDEAAKKRIARALDKLRQSFAKDGTTLSATAVASALHQQALITAPALADKICAATTTHSATSATANLIAKGAAKLMAWHLAKTSAIASVCILAGLATTTIAIHTIHADAPPIPVASAPAPSTPDTADAPTTAPAYVYVMGKVKRPGVYQLTPGMLPGQVLSAAGLTPDLRDTGWMTIIRRINAQQEQTMTLRVAVVIDSIDAPPDAQVLRANDVLNVGVNPPAANAPAAATVPARLPIVPADIPPVAGDKGFFEIHGTTVKAGTYTLSGQQITVKMALAAALKSPALGDYTVTLHRRVEGSPDKLVTMNMKAVVEGREADRFLQSGDVLEVSKP